MEIPYAPQPSAKIPGVPISEVTPFEVEVPGKYLRDPGTLFSNELVVILETDQPSKLKDILPSLDGQSAPAIERALLKRINGRDSQTLFAFGNPAHARYLLTGSRLSDDERALWQAGSDGTLLNGKPTNARLVLNRYIILRYESVELAKRAQEVLKRSVAVSQVTFNGSGVFSFQPNDPYYQSWTAFKYQWGLHAMNFGAAWDVSRGQAYLGILDGDQPGNYNESANPFRKWIAPHPELVQNYRPQFSPPPVVNSGNLKNHTIHVAGIAAAQFNNGTGVAGACPECSFSAFPMVAGTFADYVPNDRIANGLMYLVNAGMQVVNWSGGAPDYTCESKKPDGTLYAICDALQLATDRSVLVVISAGNDNNGKTEKGTQMNNGPHFPANMHEGTVYDYSVLPVGGVGQTGSRWTEGCVGLECGSNYASTHGVVAAAKRVVSTFNAGGVYGYLVSECSDKNNYGEPVDASARDNAGFGDGIGSCTGTSMSAPFITGLAGLVRSINPRATASQVGLTQEPWKSRGCVAPDADSSTARSA